MYAMRTSCPYSVRGRYELGYGYGHSSHVMLPGLTSEGAAAVWFCAAAGCEPATSAATDNANMTLFMVSPGLRPAAPACAPASAALWSPARSCTQSTTISVR